MMRTQQRMTAEAGKVIERAARLLKDDVEGSADHSPVFYLCAARHAALNILMALKPEQSVEEAVRLLNQAEYPL